MSSMSKIGKYVGITGLVLAVLAMASGTGFAATITITDLTDVNPVVATDLANVTVNTLTPEMTVFTGDVTTGLTGNSPKWPFPCSTYPCTKSVALVEFKNGPISDIITVTAQAPNATTNIQSIEVTFTSDADGIPLTLPSTGTVITLIEDGTLQDLTTSFGIGGKLPPWNISVQSDAPEAVSEPGTLFLLGSGLTGLGLLGVWRRSRRLASAQT